MWEEISAKLQERLSKDNYSLWLAPVEEESFKNNTLVLTVPNEFYIRPLA